MDPNAVGLILAIIIAGIVGILICVQAWRTLGKMFGHGATCPSCGSQNLSAVVLVHYDPLRRCRDCGLVA